jgi:hypothetical protein
VVHAPTNTVTNTVFNSCVGMSSNVGRPWSRRDYENLDRQGLQGTKTQRLRQKIELALLEDCERSDAAIGRLLDSNGATVGKVRAMLVSDEKIIDTYDRKTHND